MRTVSITHATEIIKGNEVAVANTRSQEGIDRFETLIDAAKENGVDFSDINSEEDVINWLEANDVEVLTRASGARVVVIDEIADKLEIELEDEDDDDDDEDYDYDDDEDEDEDEDEELATVVSLLKQIYEKMTEERYTKETKSSIKGIENILRDILGAV